MDDEERIEEDIAAKIRSTIEKLTQAHDDDPCSRYFKERADLTSKVLQKISFTVAGLQHKHKLHNKEVKVILERLISMIDLEEGMRSSLKKDKTKWAEIKNYRKEQKEKQKRERDTPQGYDVRPQDSGEVG